MACDAGAVACDAGAAATERGALEAACPTASDAAPLLAGAALRVSLLAALTAARERARAADEALSHLVLPRALRAACAPLERAAAAFAPRLAACSLGGAAWPVGAVCALAALAFFAAGASTRADAQVILLGLAVITVVFVMRCAMSALGGAPLPLPRTGVALENANVALADELRDAEAIAAAAEERLAAAAASDAAGASRDNECRAALMAGAYRVMADAAVYARGPDAPLTPPAGACARVNACVRSWQSVAHATVALLFLAAVSPLMESSDVVFFLAVPVAARAAFAACCCNATLRFGVDVLLLLATTGLYSVVAAVEMVAGRRSGAY